MLKARQIECLIKVLPGIENNAEQQEARIRALEGELRAVEEERGVAMAELDGWRERVARVLGGVRR